MFLNLVLLLLLVNFVIGFKLELMYISLIVNISGQASVAYAAAIYHRNHFFRLYQQNKFSEPKVKFRQASNHCKRVLEAAKLACANETKDCIFSKKLGSWDFWQNAIVSSIKVNLVYFFYSTAHSCCLLHLIKQNCLLKIF